MIADRGYMYDPPPPPPAPPRKPSFDWKPWAFALGFVLPAAAGVTWALVLAVFILYWVARILRKMLTS